MANINLGLTVVLIEPKNPLAETALDLPQNERYLVSSASENAARQHPQASRECTPLVEPLMATCALSLTHIPNDPLTGWVFGSDEGRCDFLLATSNEKTGVSGRHFGINYNWTSSSLLLTNLSRHFVRMSSPKIDPDLIIRGTHVIPPGEDTTITAGAVTLIIRIPTRGEHQDAFDRELELYHAKVKAAMPLFPPGILGKHLPETPQVILVKRSRVQYLIQDEGDIGVGAFGSVSKALDPTTGNLYAAKRFHNQKTNKKYQTRRLDAIGRELALHKKISHAHIVRMIDIQEDALSPLLIMEYLSCGNLAQQENFTLRETVRMLEQQLEAVAYLHELKITHRDIKPENILLQARHPDLLSKLSDFGLSKDLSRESSEMITYCGSPLYLAPEVRADIKVITATSSTYTSTVDVWSLGAVALQYAYSFPKRTKQRWACAVHYHALKQSGALAEILQHMLSWKPSNRPSAKDCLASLKTASQIPKQKEFSPVGISGERHSPLFPDIASANENKNRVQQVERRGGREDLRMLRMMRRFQRDEGRSDSHNPGVAKLPLSPFQTQTGLLTPKWQSRDIR